MKKETIESYFRRKIAQKLSHIEREKERVGILQDLLDEHLTKLKGN